MPMPKPKLDKLRVPLKELEDLLADVYLALEDDDVVQARSLLEDYFDDENDDD